MRSGPDFVVARLSSISIRRPIGLIKGRYWSCVASRRWCLTLSHGRSGLFSYAAINLDGADVQIREQPRQGLGRNEVAIGDVVGFLDRNQQERNGRIVRLNDKTVTLLCGQQQWRVAYSLLHRVVEGSAFNGEPLVLDASVTCVNTEDIGRDE